MTTYCDFVVTWSTVVITYDYKMVHSNEYLWL